MIRTIMYDRTKAYRIVLFALLPTKIFTVEDTR